jgi:hypothetical protein
MMGTSINIMNNIIGRIAALCEMTGDRNDIRVHLKRVSVGIERSGSFCAKCHKASISRVHGITDDNIDRNHNRLDSILVHHELNSHVIDGNRSQCAEQNGLGMPMPRAFTINLNRIWNRRQF